MIRHLQTQIDRALSLLTRPPLSKKAVKGLSPAEIAIAKAFWDWHWTTEADKARELLQRSEFVVCFDKVPIVNQNQCFIEYAFGQNGPEKRKLELNGLNDHVYDGRTSPLSSPATYPDLVKSWVRLMGEHTPITVAAFEQWLRNEIGKIANKIIEQHTNDP